MEFGGDFLKFGGALLEKVAAKFSKGAAKFQKVDAEKKELPELIYRNADSGKQPFTGTTCKSTSTATSEEFGKIFISYFYLNTCVVSKILPNFAEQKGKTMPDQNNNGRRGNRQQPIDNNYAHLQPQALEV